MTVVGMTRRASKIETLHHAAALAGASIALLTVSALADPPDLAKYECTRTDDGKVVAADMLAKVGFRIVSQARFGAVNLLMADRKSTVRANCFLRGESKH